MLISGSFTCFSSTSFPVEWFARSSLLSANPVGWVRAKSWLLGCPEVASPVRQRLYCGRRAPGCVLGLRHHLPTPVKEYFVGTALPFEVASLVRLCGCYRAALSRELLTQLASSSLLPQLLYLGWAVGAEPAGPVAGGWTAVPAQGVQIPLALAPAEPAAVALPALL